MTGVKFRNGNWWIDYRANGKRIRKKIGPNKTLAMNILRKRKIEIIEGKHLDIQRQNKIKFKDFAVTYLDNHCKQNNKAWNFADWTYLNPANKKGLVGYFGEKYLHEITPLMIEEYKRIRRADVSAATVNRILQILSSLFSKAVDWDILKENPRKKVKLFVLNNKRLRYLERAEIKQLLAVCSPKLHAIVTLAINTGLRRGEIEKLKWQDVDFEKNLICILEQKNGNKTYISLNEHARNALMKVKRHSRSEFVFCKSNGDSYSFRRSYDTALKRAGISSATFHTLRHTFASFLAMSGIDMNSIRELMRHKSLAMTQRYAHLSRDFKSRAVDVLAGQMDSIWTPKPSVINYDVVELEATDAVSTS